MQRFCQIKCTDAPRICPTFLTCHATVSFDTWTARRAPVPWIVLFPNSASVARRLHPLCGSACQPSQLGHRPRGGRCSPVSLKAPPFSYNYPIYSPIPIRQHKAGRDYRSSIDFWCSPLLVDLCVPLEPVTVEGRSVSHDSLYFHFSSSLLRFTNAGCRHSSPDCATRHP